MKIEMLNVCLSRSLSSTYMWLCLVLATSEAFTLIMTTKEILDKQINYNINELEKMKREELVEIVKAYSLKHSHIRKDMLINAIIQYQQQIIDLKSKLIANNPIQQYFRGTVGYRLPTLIIYQIIQDIWNDDIIFNTNTDQLFSNYRWLFSIALVCKELFQLISTLFTRFQIESFQIFGDHSNPDTVGVEIKNHYLNQHSILKIISHLTMSLDILKEIASKSTKAELVLIFNHVYKLKLIVMKNKPMLIQQTKSMIQLMPNLESVQICGATINNINRPTGYIHIKSKHRFSPGPLHGTYRADPVANYAKKIYNVSVHTYGNQISENRDDNRAIEKTYPNLKFLYYRRRWNK
ncbi:hypothetical protein PPL_06563 [Heterostelium album PN500]|uniref:Uncharacterized protein n=1 Tax=Heterostelium pallidum (strain ATCC 26659 / Pp 5 / PN500) TaxID=670386 RepID=D3BDI0_HETP5|nr:hypothetical protein PPL_06563 [Heterostelium album PN500]EFA80525.1 hypothetical protein PPL_06563 [Heterostelium album PN500]|eukprot:XP_020432645.1 hypothetical protein PPL_06563 [Heterostelium album PN500]